MLVIRINLKRGGGEKEKRGEGTTGGRRREEEGGGGEEGRTKGRKEKEWEGHTVSSCLVFGVSLTELLHPLESSFEHWDWCTEYNSEEVI